MERFSVLNKDLHGTGQWYYLGFAVRGASGIFRRAEGSLASLLATMSSTETFQHYQVLKNPDGSLCELGRGAMGVTYKAFDTSLRCHVALKVINAAYLDSEMAGQRFLREARAAAGLSHPNVASVFHLGEEGGNYFYAMEYINGETVRIAGQTARARCPPVVALKITLQVARALRAAARLGLVHRDIKPANLMLVREDEEDTGDEDLIVKVIDFGLAKVARKDGAEASIVAHGCRVRGHAAFRQSRATGRKGPRRAFGHLQPGRDPVVHAQRATAFRGVHGAGHEPAPDAQAAF